MKDSDPRLIPCLVQLRKELNERFPNRAKDSDGWIGDTAHQASTSDHNPDETGNVPIHDSDRVNEVHAIDVDVNLRDSSWSMERLVQWLLARCRSGAEKRLRYIIFNRRIWEASNGWRQRAYTGASAHTEHSHLSASYDAQREADTRPWLAGLDPEDDMDEATLRKIIREELQTVLTETTDLKGPDGKPDGTKSTQVGHNVLSQGVPNPFEDGRRSPFYKLVSDIASAVKPAGEASPGA